MERSNSKDKGKRALDAAEEGRPRKKRLTLEIERLVSEIVEDVRVDCLQRLCSSLEPIIQKLGPEEVKRALAKLCAPKLSGRYSPKQIEGPDRRNFQLHFRSRLSLPIFTGSKVEGEQGAPIRIVLLDANTGHAVTSGPESSVKIDVVVLEGDFNNEDDDDWTGEEFEQHVVKEREGKRPLLTGNLQVILKEGVGTLGELTFTDNSSWLRSRSFRLGLKVALGYCEGIRIREAKTEAFAVKDHRGELYKKHYPPALNDDIWRLETIRKDGSFHKRLNQAEIYTVKDFLRLVVRDSQGLRNILGSGMSNKLWNALIRHARTCDPSAKLYAYFPDDARKDGVVLNSIYELSGLIADGEYFSADSLSGSQKDHADTLVKKAHENPKNIIEYNCETLLSFELNRSSGASGTEVPVGPNDNSFDHQLTLPSLPALVPLEPPSLERALTVRGHNDSMATSYTTQLQNVNRNTQIQVDGTSFLLQNLMTNASHQAQPLISDNAEFPTHMPSLLGMLGTSDMGGHAHSINVTEGGLTSPRRSENVLSQGPPQLSASVSLDTRTLNVTSYGEVENFHPQEEIGGRSGELSPTGIDWQQYLLDPFDLDCFGESSTNDTEDGHCYSSNSRLGKDERHSSGRAIIGWLKLKAAMRWAIFTRKKDTSRHAQLVELVNNRHTCEMTSA